MTRVKPSPHFFDSHFNPHEREARDNDPRFIDARTGILIHTSVKLVTLHAAYIIHRLCNFNPHEREARDKKPSVTCVVYDILIHTSVKLVTKIHISRAIWDEILIHTSVKLVTSIS